MRIGRADFDSGYPGRVHQAVLDAVPEDEAVDEAELRAAYDRAVEDDKPSFERVVDDLRPQVERKRIGERTFYIRRRPLLTTAEVARRLGVSKRTVQAWAQQGKLLGQQVGGRVRFAAESVEDWMRGRRTTTSYTVSDPPQAQVWDNEKDAGYDRG